MSYLPRTEEAFAEVMSNRTMGVGDHMAPTLMTGVPGLQLGYRAFNPDRDPVDAIDHLAPMAAVLDEYQVKVVSPVKPLHINVVTDYTSTVQHQAFADAKRRLGEDIGEAISEALPGISDVVEAYAIGNAIPRDLDLEVKKIHTDSPEATADAIKQVVFDGLTFVISSFGKLRFSRDQVQDSLVAVKLNHPLERRIPEGLRRPIVVAGLTEIDPRNKRKLRAFNAGLQQRHEEIVASLEAAGAGVASVVASRDRHGYDADIADTEIAEAIRQLA